MSQNYQKNQTEEEKQQQGFCTVEEAKEIAREIFKKYDYDQKGELGKGEIGPIMIDIYKGMKVMFNPSIHDVESFAKIVDTDGDNKITLDDLEKFAIKYLASI